MTNPASSPIYSQSAAIPFRTFDETLEVLIITARAGKHWIVPKGIIETGHSPQTAAALEAYEEAGIKGQVYPNAIGEYRYQKWQGTCHVQVFLMQVAETLADWPEKSFRTRRWVTPETACDMINEPALKNLLGRLPQLVARMSPPTSR